MQPGGGAQAGRASKTKAFYKANKISLALLAGVLISLSQFLKHGVNGISRRVSTVHDPCTGGEGGGGKEGREGLEKSANFRPFSDIPTGCLNSRPTVQLYIP